MNNNYKKFMTITAVVAMLCIVGCEANNTDATKPAYELTSNSNIVTNETIKETDETEQEINETTVETDETTVKEFDGNPYFIINNNKYDESIVPIINESYEFYSELDNLGRCGIAHACVGKDLMPTEERGSIGSVKPSGWQTAKYDNISGKYLYNRCHLIGYQLTAENANEKNLITGTRYLNIDGMLPFENMVADYIKETNNHVMYVVIPIFTGDNLVADGVQMMARSVEDNGEAIEFNVFCYNVQPGITINYIDGTSKLADNNTKDEINTDIDAEQDIDEEQSDEKLIFYVINENTHKFHTETCRYVNEESENQKFELTYRDKLIEDGYEPCKVCNP